MDPLVFTIPVFLFMAAAGVAGYLIGGMHERERTGFWLGFLLGPVGLVLLLLMRVTKVRNRPWSRDTRIPVARNGQRLGTWTVDEILGDLDGGKLSPEDQYFDAASGGWIPLRGSR